MSTNRTNTQTTSSRRKASRRTIVRRGWLVQRLESRCVMAADLMGSESAESPWADDSGSELTEQVPSLIRSTPAAAPADEAPQTTVFDEPDVELTIDRFDSAVDDIVVDDIVVDDIGADELAVESIELVDLLDSRSIDLQVHQNSTVVFTWNVSQLDQLLGRSDSLAIHVIYDASRWQAPQFDASLSMLSLADQSVHVQIDVQAGNVDDGTLPEIFIKLTDPNSSDTNSENWTTEEFDWQVGLTSTTSFAPTESWDSHGSKVGQADPMLGINSMIGEESGAQPFSEGDSAPPPESRDEAPDRNSRTARRTLDLRATGVVSSLAPLTSRTPATPGSLATQASIAGVYKSESSTVAGQSRWLLDPKPARLQVATFVLSRSSDSSRSVAVRSDGTRSVDHSEQTTSGLEKQASTPTATTESVSQYFISQGSLVDSASESAIDDTVTQVDERLDETHQELEEAVREIPVYASILDRLLGSPVSFIAVLGLTVITRFAEPEELEGL